MTDKLKSKEYIEKRFITFNGEKLPSTDYWFTVDYLPQNSQTRQTFRAHFSLIR